jgi:hypothetical protein
MQLHLLLNTILKVLMTMDLILEILTLKTSSRIWVEVQAPKEEMEEADAQAVAEGNQMVSEVPSLTATMVEPEVATVDATAAPMIPRVTKWAAHSMASATLSLRLKNASLKSSLLPILLEDHHQQTQVKERLIPSKEPNRLSAKHR